MNRINRIEEINRNNRAGWIELKQKMNRMNRIVISSDWRWIENRWIESFLSWRRLWRQLQLREVQFDKCIQAAWIRPWTRPGPGPMPMVFVVLVWCDKARMHLQTIAVRSIWQCRRQHYAVSREQLNSARLLLINYRLMCKDVCSQSDNSDNYDCA